MKTIEKDGIILIINNSKKIKNIRIKIHFLSEIENNSKAVYTLLSRILNNITPNYPTKTKLARMLENNYGMSFSFKNETYYKLRDFSLSLNTLNGKYLNNKKIILKAFSFLKDLIVNPLIYHEELTMKNIEEERSKLITNINNIVNDKRKYSLYKTLELVFEEDFRIVANIFTVEDLQKITYQDLLNAYKKIMSNSKIIMSLTGDFEDDFESNYLLNDIAPLLTTVEVPFNTMFDKKLEVNKTIIETKNSNQSVLTIAYTGEYYEEKDKVYDIFAMMLGGIQQSTLNTVVREQHSLCYSIEASYNLNLKLLVIQVGIDKDKYEQCVELIDNIINDYQNGKVDPELLKMVIDAQVTSLEEIYDYPPALTSLHFDSIIYEDFETIEEAIKENEQTTIEDVIEVSKLFKKAVTHFVKGDSE